MDPDTIGLLLNSLTTLIVAWLANKKRVQLKTTKKLSDVIPVKPMKGGRK